MAGGEGHDKSEPLRLAEIARPLHGVGVLGIVAGIGVISGRHAQVGLRVGVAARVAETLSEAHGVIVVPVVWPLHEAERR